MKRKGRKKRGRPTKLNADTQSKVCHAIAVGAPYPLASLYAGLAYNTVDSWIELGEKQRHGKFRSFLLAVKEAEGKGTVGCLATIRNASQQQWQAAAWLLERRYPDLFGRYTRLEHTGPNGGELPPNKTSVNILMNFTDLVRQLKDVSDEDLAVIARLSERAHAAQRPELGQQSGANGSPVP